MADAVPWLLPTALPGETERRIKLLFLSFGLSMGFPLSCAHLQTALLKYYFSLSSLVPVLVCFLL